MAQDTTAVFTATHRFARISAQKARLVMDLIRGEPVERALTTLRFCQRRASPMIGKVLRSALANATQKAGLEGEDLVVWRAFVDGGPIAKRWRPRAMGRGYPRLRRTCHLSVVLKQVPRKTTKRKGAGHPTEQPRGRGRGSGGPAARSSQTAPGSAPVPDSTPSGT